MKISTEIGSLSKHVGEEKAVEMVAKAGFDAWDFSMFAMCKYDWRTQTVLPTDHPLAGNDYLALARKLKKIGLDNGIVCNQSHAPFPTGNAVIRSYFKRAIECTAEAGGKICIIHPDNPSSAEVNAELYNELLPFAESYGVKIAAENMWSWNDKEDQASFAACATPEDFCKHIDIVNSENLVACLDLGHAEMRGLGTSAVEMIKALDKRLQALHIHDNDKWHDSHQIPFSMDIDFVPIVKALKEIDYNGYFTLEADTYLNDCPPEQLEEKVGNLARAAKKLAEMFENA